MNRKTFLATIIGVITAPFVIKKKEPLITPLSKEEGEYLLNNPGKINGYSNETAIINMSPDNIEMDIISSTDGGKTWSYLPYNRNAAPPLKWMQGPYTEEQWRAIESTNLNYSILTDITEIIRPVTPKDLLYLGGKRKNKL